ncbi:hypothetical protein ACFQI7_33115 [Paenibacillus allorhizosphaerae]|uniref:Copper amine oxidase N-terminal domain-containing protein n=1 Tax=Paenibacillus allorhizosphaerae TaxID=2849866 RepID=A0ABN7TWS2_9BACL|nr:hypothetical protein [Paenibacillus allorhizosphaerae]CAG7654949.1 hypothetical protein PAECIP111802_05947 [Paenibacillus allorhizosphaerae]
MKLKSVLLVVLLASGLTFTLAEGPAHAASKDVTVTLPAFPVELDGIELDNAHLKYPLLTYNDITYIPMTWSVSQATGLQSSWSEENGLEVNLDMPLSIKPEPETGGSFRSGRYAAQVADFPVRVNREAVSNAEQTYPLLVFQDVTYFPLTWDYAVNRFRWKLTWSDADGLSIATSQRRYMSGIIYDDDDSLYTFVHNVKDRMFRIPKNLEGLPELLTAQQSKQIMASRQAAMESVPPQQEIKPKQTVYQDHQLWYDGKPLISVEKEEAGNRLADRDENTPKDAFLYGESVIELGADTKVFTFRIPTGPRNPVETPASRRLVIVHQGVAEELTDFRRSVVGVRKTNDGAWLWTSSPTRLSARTGSERGEVLWVGADGTHRSWSQILNAQYVRVLHDEDNELIVQAYELFRPENASPPTTGYFRLHSDGTYDKIGDLTEETILEGAPLIADNLDAYVDRDKNIYVVRNNTISNVNQGMGRTWWDYELKEITREYPDAGY